MERTEQEKKIETALFQLIETAGNMLRLEFISSTRPSSNREEKTGVRRDYDIIYLTLKEPSFPIDLDEWAEAIVKAEHLVGKIEKERIHERQNPNFFKAVIAKYTHLK